MFEYVTVNMTYERLVISGGGCRANTTGLFEAQKELLPDF